MKKYHLVPLIAFTLSACSSVDSMRVFDDQQAQALIQETYTIKPARQEIELSLPRDQQWKPVKRSGQKAPVMLLPASATPTDWQQSIQTKVRPYTDKRDTTPQEFARIQIDANAKNCQTVHFNFLQQTEHYVIYQATTQQCTDHPDQKQIGKVFAGRDAVYLVEYNAVIGKIADAQYQRMAKNISNAKLIRS